MVCIKDFKMPNGCIDCRLHWPGDCTEYCLAQRDVIDDGYGTSRLTLHHIKDDGTGSWGYDFKEETCPLFEVEDNSKLDWEKKMAKDYQAIFVANDPENGILFAKKSNSEKETMIILGEEICRLLSDFEGEVVLSKKQDGYGESVLVAEYDEKVMKLEYKIVFEEEENNEMQ